MRYEDLPLSWSVLAFVVLGTYKEVAMVIKIKKEKTVEYLIMVEMGFQYHPVARMFLYLPLIGKLINGRPWSRLAASGVRNTA